MTQRALSQHSPAFFIWTIRLLGSSYLAFASLLP
ncbi:hypothetical protein [Escherichia phage PH1062]|nr:hypothetical protein [Escherichia phage PH1062]